MEIIEKEITPLEMMLLIRRGILLEFQHFINEAGGRKQVYRTKVASKQILYVCYHFAPFSFMTTTTGKVFTEQTASRFQNKSNC